MDTKQTRELVDKVMSQPIPNMKTQKAPKRAITTLKEVKLSTNFPDDVETWEAKHFTHYFAAVFHAQYQGHYHANYRADVPAIKTIMKRLKSQGLTEKKWMKDFIDWFFQNIKSGKKATYITPNSMVSQTNAYYQQKIMPMVETQELERYDDQSNLIEDIKNAYDEGRISNVFKTFGIPIAATFFIRHRQVSEKAVESALLKHLKEQSKKGLAGHEVLHEICMASLLGSPYPDNFYMLDWRRRFNTVFGQFAFEKWWRDEDYKGTPLNKYKALEVDNE